MWIPEEKKRKEKKDHKRYCQGCASGGLSDYKVIDSRKKNEMCFKVHLAFAYFCTLFA